MAFSTLRVATILSAFASGTDNIVVCERNLRDSLLFHEMWREVFSLADMDDFFAQFYKLLAVQPFEYKSITIWLRSSIDVLMTRIASRGEVFEHNHSRQF